MNINYIKDHKLEYRTDLIKGLTSYNKAFAGDSPSTTSNVYVLDDKKLVGGCHTQLIWNWVNVQSLFYNNKKALIAIMNELYQFYKGKAEGIIVESYIKHRIEDFKLAGFKVLGVLVDKPIGFESHIMTNTNMTVIPVNHTYCIEIIKEKHENYTKIVDEEVKIYNKKFKINEAKTEIQYVALDKERFVGGVYGYIMQDYLYVSTLWVDEAYRCNDIATKLMDIIEADAIEKGYKNFYLGTCTFQAKGFYEKRGYKAVMITSNCPKGYDDYMMVKKS
ncbi:GNAT family N-acetyltransferase [Alkaliphilus pronyensis]|uniref:GNAT family N-acetyltransferase n=1 Tax=Alkaliphilus pronyensis TaxID=1482732 RepID=A0A6I0F5A8_9FIRM|nr:GNAT family N-acetyltransferase [Alkaliphilus pronyensis]KAB3530668.1 GNAT family N-acetyltransferase [Alkaliphilus pronyensis]